MSGLLLLCDLILDYAMNKCTEIPSELLAYDFNTFIHWTRSLAPMNNI